MKYLLKCQNIVSSGVVKKQRLRKIKKVFIVAQNVDILMENRITICHGTTRIVFLVGKYAIKIPSFAEYKLFLHGLLANMQEFAFSKTNWPELCPVCFYIPFGIMVIMPKCEPLTREQFDNFDYDKFTIHDDYVLTFIEHKMDSFGILNNKIVAVDYGS